VGDAGNGHDAARRIVRLQPDVAVMDIRTSGLDGIEATRRVKEACPSTQVVILSVGCSRWDVHRAVRAGARGYVLKDSPSGEVIKAVREVSVGHVYFCPEVQYLMSKEIRDPGTGRLGPDDLTERQQDVLYRILGGGKSNREIAEELCLSIKTVQTYRSPISSKLGCSNVLELVRWAYENGILPLEKP
jgi:two-component system response regulator NreC